MTFSIIGTGNIAWFFGRRLMAGGHKCAGVYGRNTLAVAELADSLMARSTGGITDIRDGEADICFIAVADHAISEVATSLSFQRTVLVHTAGAMELELLKNAATDSAVLWPVYSILKNNLPAHRNIPCAWEASTTKAEKLLLVAGNAITDVMFEARYDQRKWLHLSAVISNNFINHLMAIGEQICAENKLPFATLLPIIEQTFDRTRHASPKDLQTGPAIRRDESTIEGQLALLGQHPAWQKVYEAITQSIQAP